MAIKKRLKVIGNFLLPGKIPYVILYITSKCNARCKTCFYWQNLNKEKDELTLDEIERISRNFPALQQLSITGGEPYLREDLPEICRIFSKNTKVPFVTIPTNGLLSGKIAGMTEDILRTCPETHFRISLSLDGVGKLHDEIRGTPGNFKAALKTFNKLANLRKYFKNISIDIATVLSNFNQDKIEEIFDYVGKNLDVDNHVVVFTRGNPREAKAKDVSLDNYKKAVGYIKKRSKRKEHRPFSALFRAVFEMNYSIIAQTVQENKMIIPCMAGKKLLVISETAEVYPCEILPPKMGFGNLRDVNFNLKKLLNSAKAEEILKFIKESKCYCTFECAVNTNIIYNPRLYPKIFKNAYLNRQKSRT